LGRNFILGHFLIFKLAVKSARETLHNEMCHTSNGAITTKEKEKEKRVKPNSNTSVKKKGVIGLEVGVFVVLSSNQNHHKCLFL
jgi:hypothetical protein